VSQQQPPSGPSTRLPRLIAALAAALAAVRVTTYSTFWIWNKADALTPVDLPSANGTPLETVNPSAKPSPKPTPPPPPKGTIDGAFMVDYKGDRMPIMAAPWRKEKYEPITLGGVAQWLDVHVKYDGQSSWGNLAGFGLFDPENTTYKGKASLNYASRLVGGRMLNRFYQGKPVPIKSTVKHRDLTINGHPAHELIARIPVKQPKLKETYSQLAIIVIDRGDGTAVAAYGDFSGTTAARWLPIWRQHVAKIQIAG